MRMRGVKVVGEWWLWIYIARWRLMVEGSRVNGRSSRRKMGAALNLLEGQRLAGTRVHNASGATTLDFDLGAQLEIRRWNRGDTDDLWTLSEPNGMALAVTADGRMTHEAADKEDRYVPLDKAGAGV